MKKQINNYTFKQHNNDHIRFGTHEVIFRFFPNFNISFWLFIAAFFLLLFLIEDSYTNTSIITNTHTRLLIKILTTPDYNSPSVETLHQYLLLQEKYKVKIMSQPIEFFDVFRNTIRKVITNVLFRIWIADFSSTFFVSILNYFEVPIHYRLDADLTIGKVIYNIIVRATLISFFFFAEAEFVTKFF